MNKKIILSLSVIGIVAAVAISGTVAYFSDTETSTGNTLTAGTIDLAVNDENPLDSKVFTVEDVKPSEETEPVRVNLQNVGTNDGIVDLHILPGTHSEGIDSEPECEAECGPGFWRDNVCKRHWPGCDNQDENICDKIHYDYCYDSNDNGVCDEEDMQGDLDACENIWLGRLLTGENTRYLWISYHLDESAGNRYQGDTCTFDIEFSLHQLVTGESGVLGFMDENGDPVDGSMTYWPGSLMMEVHASGLISDGCYQITLEDEGVCTETSDRLASGVEGHTANFDAGYYENNWAGGLKNSCNEAENGWGVYNPEYTMVEGGNLDTVFKINVKGEGYGYPGLPSGAYEDVRMVVKQINAGQVGCPKLNEAPVWNCGAAGTACYIGKLFTDYNINFGL